MSFKTRLKLMSLRLSDPRDLDCCCARSFVLMLLNPKSYRLGTGSENPQSSLASSPLRIPTLFSASFSSSTLNFSSPSLLLN